MQVLVCRQMLPYRELDSTFWELRSAYRQSQVRKIARNEFGHSHWETAQNQPSLSGQRRSCFLVICESGGALTHLYA